MINDENIISYPNNIDTRVALLEMSIVNINETMKEIKGSLKEIRNDIKEIRKDMKSDFRWLLGTIFGLGAFLFGGLVGITGIMAHGFHWI